MQAWIVSLLKTHLFCSGEEEDDDSSNDRPAGMKIARMGSEGVGRAAVRSPDPSPVRRSNRARKVRQVVKEDSEEGMCQSPTVKFGLKLLSKRLGHSFLNRIKSSYIQTVLNSPYCILNYF